MNLFQLERIKYSEDSPPEIVELIRARVSIQQRNIILLKEIPIVSSFSIDIVFREMTRYASQFEKCGYLVDITETSLPDSEVRRHINSQFQDTLSNVKHVAFVTGRNFIINTAAKFVMYQTKLDSFSICKNIDEGVIKIKEALNASAGKGINPK